MSYKINLQRDVLLGEGTIKKDKSKNLVNVLYPYRTKGGTWVYDDEDVPVIGEAFVCGSSELIDMLVGKDCNAFIAYVSASPLPNSVVHLTNVDEEENEGVKKKDWMKGWYEMEGTGHRNWFCGHLLDYFDGYPSDIYVSIKK